MSTRLKTEPNPYNTPPWRRSHSAMSPDSTNTAAIDNACEHSMSNPTVGTLRTSDGLELPNCNPAFIWSDNSQYLAVPRWCRRFGVFLRQRLAIIDVANRAVYVSKFTYWLLLPKSFEGGKLEVQVSDSRGISWPWKSDPIVLTVPTVLPSFTELKDFYREPGSK